MSVQEDPLGPRVGTFFILIGIGLLILFAASDVAPGADVEFDYFFLGVLGVVIGILFRRKAPKPPPSNRFSRLRTMREKSKQRKEDKKKKKK